MLRLLVLSFTVVLGKDKDIGECEGSQKEVLGCNQGPCDTVVCQDCEWSEWGDWGPCTCVGLMVLIN